MLTAPRYSHVRERSIDSEIEILDPKTTKNYHDKREPMSDIHNILSFIKSKYTLK